MIRSKSCRCKMCCSCQRDCDPCYPDCCSYHRKNRFSKLRKQWSEHSKCGSKKLCPEDCTRSRSPCLENVGRIGVAWVTEIPDFDNGEPKGWQVEIKDTNSGILRRCRELIDWLNNPPAHLFHSIEGNDENIRLPKCNPIILDRHMEEPSFTQEIPCNCEVSRAPKKSRMNKCYKEKVVQYCCENSQKNTKDCQTKFPKCSCINCRNQCCEKDRQYEECSDREEFNRFKTSHNKYSQKPPVCDEFSDVECSDAFERCRTKCYEHSKRCDAPSDQEMYQAKHHKIKCGLHHSNTIKLTQNENIEDISEGEKADPPHKKCPWSTAIPNECDVIFQKENCCCNCQQKFFKNAETIYETDIVPQKDKQKNNILSPKFSELDSKIICAGVRTSQICKKLMEDKRKELMQKYKKELDSVIADKSSEEGLAQSIYVSAHQENQSVLNSNLTTHSNGSQRRSNKFRKKETDNSKINEIS